MTRTNAREASSTRAVGNFGRPVATVVLALLGVVLSAAVAVEPANATPAKSARVLAQRLTHGSAHTAVGATWEILARSGIPVRDGQRLLARPARPALKAPFTRFEALNLALDARNQAGGGRITLDQLGREWVRAGVFRPRGRSAGVRMRTFLADWVRAARRHPRRPTAFAPLLLAELARRQVPSIDLSRGRYAPRDLRLSLLELDIISASLAALPVRRRPVPADPRADAAADAVTCSDTLNKVLGKNTILNQYVTAIVGNAGGDVVAGALTGLVTSHSAKDVAGLLESNKKAIGSALSIVSALLRIQRAAALYAAVQIYVDVDPASVERPEDQQNVDVRFNTPFTAVVGLKPDAEEAYRAEMGQLGEDFRATRKALADCASLVGVPTPANESDAAEDLDAFRVHWTLDADSRDARYEFQQTRWLAKGARIGALTRVDKTLAAHVMFAQIQPQQPWRSHPEDFVRRARAADATAALDLSQPPSLGTLVNAVLAYDAPFGLADALVESAVGMFQSIKMPKDTGRLRVTFHVPACGGRASAVAAQVCQPDVTAHVVSTAQCTGQPEPVVTDDFRVVGSADRRDPAVRGGRRGSGTVSGHWSLFSGNGCEAFDDTKVSAEPTTITVARRGKRLDVGWSPRTTTRWTRMVDVPATPGEHTVHFDQGDENGHFRETVTVTVANLGT